MDRAEEDVMGEANCDCVEGRGEPEREEECRMVMKTRFWLAIALLVVGAAGCGQMSGGSPEGVLREYLDAYLKG